MIIISLEIPANTVHVIAKLNLKLYIELLFLSHSMYFRLEHPIDSVPDLAVFSAGIDRCGNFVCCLCFALYIVLSSPIALDPGT